MSLYNGNNTANFREYANNARFNASTDHTLAIWVNPAGTPVAQEVWLARGASTISGEFTCGTPASGTFNLARASIFTTALQQVPDTIQWTTRKWFHFCQTFDSVANKLTLYIDGKQRAQLTPTGAYTQTATTNVRLWMRTTGVQPGNFFVEQFGWWRTAFLPEEVDALAHGSDFTRIRRNDAIILDPLQDPNAVELVAGLGVNTGTISIAEAAPIIRRLPDLNLARPRLPGAMTRKRYRNAGIVIQDVGWQSAPTGATARTPTRAPAVDVPLPVFSVASLGLTGFDSPTPRSISPRGKLGVSFDGPVIPFLMSSGFEPPAPRTISPQGKQGTNWDGPRLAALATTGFEPLAPQTTSPRGKPGISFDASLLFAALARTGWEPGAAAVRQLRALFPGMDTPGPGFVAPLLSTGWELPPPPPRALARTQGANWDGPLVAMLRASGWEPLGPQTVSPRGRGAVNWDGPLVPFLGQWGWESASPIARQLRRLFPDAPPPLLAFLLTSGFEPPGPSTRSPIGKGAVNFDGSGLLAALAAGGWYPTPPAPSSPRGKQGVSFDAAGLFAALGITGWEALPPFTRPPRTRAPAPDAPFAPFVIALSPTGWEQPGPRTLAPHGAPGANFAGWPAFPLRSGGFEPPAPRTSSPRGKTAPSFDGPLQALLVALAQAGWETSTPLTRGSRGAAGVNVDAGILIPPRLVTGWEPAAPYLPRSPRPGVGWNFADPTVQAFLRSIGWEPEAPRTHSPRGLPGPNHTGPWLAFLRDTGWEPPGPETISPRGQVGVNFDQPFIPFPPPPALVMIPAIPGGRGALLIIVPSRTRIG